MLKMQEIYRVLNADGTADEHDGGLVMELAASKILSFVRCHEFPDLTVYYYRRNDQSRF